jgi:hypothetical protein
MRVGAVERLAVTFDKGSSCPRLSPIPCGSGIRSDAREQDAFEGGGPQEAAVVAGTA